VGSKASEEGRDIAGVRQGERESGAVVVEGEAKKFRGDGMGFDVIEEGKDGGKKVETRAVVVPYTKVVHHQDKGDRTRDMAEEAGCGGFVETVRGEVGEKTKLRQLTCLL
jgi:hypothetical protein